MEGKKAKWYQKVKMYNFPARCHVYITDITLHYRHHFTLQISLFHHV